MCRMIAIKSEAGGNSGGIFHIIRVKMDRLSDSHKKIAEMILTDYAQVVNMSSRDLAKALSISPATVVRFAAELGYESYPKMLRDLRKTLISMSQQPMKVIRDSISQTGPIETLLDRVVQHEISSLSLGQFAQMNDAFCRTAYFMGGARNIFITGARSSLPVAQYAGYILGSLSKNVHSFPSGSDDRYERLEDLCEKDMLICISFQRYYRETVDLARFAKERKAFVAGITDYHISPLIPYCDEVMMTPADTPFITSVPTMVLLDALTFAFIQLKGDSAKEFLDRGSKILMGKNIYEDIK